MLTKKKNRLSSLDKLDRNIIRYLQINAKISISKLAKSVFSSKTTVWSRIKSLETNNVILGYTSIIEPAMVGLSLTVFVTIKTNQHNKKWLIKFSEAVTNIEEIMEVYRLSGENDYLLKIYAKDMQHYDSIYKKLINSIPINTVSSSFSMETIKNKGYFNTN